MMKDTSNRPHLSRDKGEDKEEPSEYREKDWYGQVPTK